MAPELYQPISKISQEIRLLTLLPSLDFFAGIDCTLEIVTLAEHLEVYRAISYAWGDPDNRVPITVNGIQVHITINLESALRYIRHTVNPVVLWVDAICIHQGDDSEKNHQVRLMRDIFKGAESVIAWLGSLSHDSNLAMDILANPPARRSDSGTLSSSCTDEEKEESGDDDAEAIARAGNHAIVESPSSSGLPSISDAGDSSIPSCSDIDSDEPISFFAFLVPGEAYTLAELDALNSILKRDWWSRLWIVQEAILAKQLVFKCGDKEIPRETMVQWCSLFAGGHGAARGFAHEQTFIHVTVLLAHLDAHYSYGLLSLLLVHACRDTSILSDHVYGILGIAEDATDYSPPDYSKRVEDVYIDTAITSIRLSRSLRILCRAGTGVKAQRQDLELPSWVPNWTQSYVYTPWGTFDACLGEEPKYSFSEDCLQLQVQGVAYDIVSTTKSVPLVGMGSVPLWENCLPQNKPDLYRTGISQVQATFRTLLHDQNFEARLSPERDGFFGLMTAFFSELGLSSQIELVKPTQRSSSKYIDYFVQWVRESRNGRSDEDILGAFLNQSDVGSYLQWLETVSPPDVASIYSQYCMVRNWRVGTEGCEMFQTYQGLIGIAAVDMKEGDMVCVLLGCKVPVLLRKIESHYVFLGTCFVLGIMDGEVIDELDDGKVDLQEFTIH